MVGQHEPNHSVEPTASGLWQASLRVAGLCRATHATVGEYFADSPMDRMHFLTIYWRPLAVLLSKAGHGFMRLR